MFALSTKTRNVMLEAVRTALANGRITMFSGAMPATADAAATGTILGYVTVGGGAWTAGVTTNGLNFDAAASAVLSKAAGETWTYTGLADGTVGYVRFYGNPTDAGGVSTILPRIDIAVGASGSNCIVFATTSIVTGVTGNVQSLTITLPVS